jgi:uncharacterized membrane protein
VIKRVYPPGLVTLYSVLKLLHVLSAIWLAGGLLGRAMVLAAARRGPDIRIVKAIADVSGRLENAMVAPGYLAVLVTGIATAVVGGLPLLGPFNGGPLWIFIPLVLFAVAVILTPVILGADRRWGEALADAAGAGSITDGLSVYLERGAMLRRYGPDIAFVGLIVVLMVLKPF